MQCDSLKLHEIIGLIAAIMQILGLAGVLSWSILKRRQSYNALVIAKIAGISFKIAVLFVAATALGRELYTLGFSEIFAILNGRYTGGKLWYDAAPILSLASHLTVSLLLAPLLITLTYFIFTLSFAQTWQFIARMFNFRPQITTELISDLIILEAEYFADDDHKYSITDELNKLIVNNTLSVRINNALKGKDPLQDVVKKFRIKYSYKGKIAEILGSEGQIVELG